MSDGDNSGDADGFRWTRETTVGLITVVVLIGAGLFIFDRWIMPPHRPVFDHPSAFDVLIDSRLIVGLIRLIAIILALYVLISVFAHIRGRRWIVAFGGAQTGEGDRENLRKQLEEAEANNTALLQEYENVVQLLSEIVAGMEPEDEVVGQFEAPA